MPFQKGNKINLGRKHSEEARKNMSFAHIGKKHALKHGNSPYKNYHIMKKARIKLLKRSNWKCEICGKKGKHIHHVDDSNNNHNIENLMLLCVKCHSFLHADFDNNGHRTKAIKNTKYFRKYGMTLKEIGEKLGGVSRQRVYQWTQSPEKENWVREQLGIK